MLPDEHVGNVSDDVKRCELPPPNLNSTKIFLHLVWGQTVKFKDHQYFRLYGKSNAVKFMHLIRKGVIVII